MTEYKYIKFTGEYSKLKSMGFTSQRLYAGNYMQWCNNDTRVWKKGAEVTMGRLTNFEGLFFELYTETNPEDLEFTRYGHLPVILDRKGNSVSFNYKEYLQYERECWDNGTFSDLEVVYLDKEYLAPLDEFIRLGWVELATFTRRY